MTCKREQLISLKTLSFLHSQSDHITASAPTLISVLNLRSIPWSQFPKILATLVGGHRLEAIWMIDHIDLAKRQWKNRCLIVSSWWQKIHLVLPCQFRFTRLSLVRITPRRRYHAKILVFSGIFIFQIFLLLSTGISDWIIALYKEATEKMPLACRFHRNTSDPAESWIESKIMFKKNLMWKIILCCHLREAILLHCRDLIVVSPTVPSPYWLLNSQAA
jgi:hypothetical protein